MAKPTSNSGMSTTVKKVSMGARVLDAVLCVVFAYLALKADSIEWRSFWAVGSAFCAFTAATGPLDRLPALVQRLMGVRKD
ncbi:hypothetical protein [Novosphingobium sp. 17-62-19]|uniref:hypothetical protein n=1 Tax=Novosphingobium sp. 17-62-19 TaxID=1970406 RepID=UPI0025FF7101|nr:hypothetical protein [Novosphingobium sp. 17-62-19]